MARKASLPNQLDDDAGKSMGKFVRERGIFLFLIPGLVTLFTLYVAHASWIQTVDNFAIDRYFLVRGAYPPMNVAEKLPYSRDIVLVELAHPVPRRLLARVIRQLREAKVVALDLMFVDNEAGLQTVEKTQGWYQGEIARWRKEDTVLSAAIRQNHNVVLGTWMEQNSVDTKPRLIAGGVIAPQLQYHSFWEHPKDALWLSARFRAHLSVDPEDGVVRRVRMWYATHPGNNTVPCLGLVVAAAYLGVHLSPEIGNRKVPSYIHLGQRLIPLDSDGRLLIDYMGGRESFSYVSNHADYADVLNFYEPEDFRGKIVILGESSLESKDVVRTPFGAMSGMQVHANVVASLLNPDGPLVVWPFWKTAVLTLFCSLLLADMLLLRLPPGANLLFALGEIGALAVMGAWLFIERRQVMPFGPPILAIALTYNAVALYEYQRTRRMLSTLVGRDMFRHMLGRYAPLQLGGTVKEACAVFCDLRGFSKLAAELPPTLISRILSEYVNLLVQVMRGHGGRPVSYQGDGVFILFEDVRAGEDFATNAVLAALEFVERFKILQQKLEAEGVTHLDIGVGIAYGPMMIGLVGAKDHMKPDAIGDAVNVAARLQTLSEETGQCILISRDVQVRIGANISTLYCGSYRVRGRDDPLEVYTVSAETEPVATAGEKSSRWFQYSCDHLQKALHRRFNDNRSKNKG